MKKILFTPIATLFALTALSDPPAVHGMLLFGEQANYISHLPMFHTPHDYQFIAEVDMKNVDTTKTVERYKQAKKLNTIFTIVPDPMDLAKVVSGAIKSFRVVIYQGHFERDGKIIGPAIISITKNLVAKKIAKQDGASLEFFSFGRNGEYFLTHLIFGQPTYDAIYQIDQPTKTYFPPCRRADCPDPREIPIDDQQLPIVVKADTQQFGARHPENVVFGSSRIHVSVKKPFYVEYNELDH